MAIHFKGIGYFSSIKLPLLKLANDDQLGKIVKREKGFILFHHSQNIYVYVKDFGGIAFIHPDNEDHNEVLKYLKLKYGIEMAGQNDEIKIRVQDNVHPDTFGEINIESIDYDTIHIIALNLANSATLFYYQELSEKLIENTKKHTTELELKGKVSLTRKRILKHIGATLNLKNKISENLYVFETPILAYESEILGKIDTRLREELDIQLRYNGIREQLNIVHENLDLFKDLSLHTHSSNLEWIIILLILFEVVHVFIDKIF